MKMHDSINDRNNNFVRSVHPCLREMFYKLFTSCGITLRPFMERESLNKLTLSDSKYTYAYRLHVPYATRILLWDIIFNPHDLTSAPDFDFNDEAFEEFIHRNNIMKYVPDWVHWNIKNTASLELVTQGFIKLFTEFQVNELQRVGSFISKEYELTSSLVNYNASDIEVFVDINSTHFLIVLHVDISQLPEFIQHVSEEGTLLNPNQDYALLAVYYHDNEGKNMSVQLNLSPRLNQFLGNENLLNIPPYANISLMTYVPQLTHLLQKHINDAAFKFQFKKEFVASLLILRGKSIIEYDAYFMNQVSFLCEVSGSFFLVQVRMGEQFPEEKAVVEIIPFHNFCSKLQIPAKIVFHYEESPEIIPDKMASHLLDQLKTYIIDHFKLQVPMITQ
ncbi:BRISC and BRCA1-A complex member 2-like isoform X2 [Coccinella septempunctata]|uniref:BRISC and BRCA1-A complex member 2-like isoform X2 n=1 Tax=Coccinella septempunctata TaxID=41139 RepID=UPI001D0871BA|nr:BRISC and BRCA1-A complex member 2-like isoform X2 [Coccinella septempunctata]